MGTNAVIQLADWRPSGDLLMIKSYCFLHGLYK
jgi:hypothetical protein